MPHQRLVAEVAGEIMPATGLPAYREVRISVPRQSGKTTQILVAELDRVLSWGRRQTVIYASQDRISSRSKLEEQAVILADSPLGKMFSMRRQTGFEQLIWPNGSTIGITASGKTSGHGKTIDLGVIDEAFSATDWRLEQAFRPAMLTRANAQMWVLSTAGTDESVFWNDKVDDGRARVEAGSTSGVAFFEWSANPDADADDPATWYSCMPALGRTVSVDTVQADHDSLTPDEFARAFLNIRASGGAPVIPAQAWAACWDGSSKPGGGVCMGFDVTPDRGFGSIGMASRVAGRTHVELVDHRPGTDWMVGRILELQRKWAPYKIGFEPAGPAGSLRLDLIGAGVKAEPTDGRGYAQACKSFYDAVIDGQVAPSGPARPGCGGGRRPKTAFG